MTWGLTLPLIKKKEKPEARAEHNLFFQTRTRPDVDLFKLKDKAHPPALCGLSNTLSASQKSKQKPGPFRAEEAGNGVGETAGKGLPCEDRGVTW